ncbi:MAG: DUF3137 domain-containing protein [Armatimonadota bacterium]|nr:DUF3137 domain-containing protein [Armatimonadota bacterium]MDR7444370.1 DUF3137 domain-containing protein [Armatimonadota bacterium]MDR7569639.1 DUF3137 domain-containing protein [Armatimonadota bacterium]MDR7614857.1 DUF3137 domain-containing protein [Armatimonadota bacterium]
MDPETLFQGAERSIAARLASALPRLRPVLPALEAQRRRWARVVWAALTPPALMAAFLAGSLAIGLLLLVLGLLASAVAPEVGASLTALSLSTLALMSAFVPFISFVLGPVYVFALVVGWILLVPYRDRVSSEIRTKLLEELAPLPGLRPSHAGAAEFGTGFADLVRGLVGGRPPRVNLAMVGELAGRRLAFAEVDVLPTIPRRRGFLYPGPPGRGGRQFYGLVAAVEMDPPGSPTVLVTWAGFWARVSLWDLNLSSARKRLQKLPLQDPAFDAHYEVHTDHVEQARTFLRPELRGALLYLARQLPWKPLLALGGGHAYAFVPWRGFLEMSPFRRLDERWVQNKALADLRALLRAVCLAAVAAGVSARDVADAFMKEARAS